MKLLQVRGEVRARQSGWMGAEQDLATVLALADREGRVEPPTLRYLLMDYAVVLRKIHWSRDARLGEKHIKALGGSHRGSDVVDVAEFLRRPKRLSENRTIR
jgi:hypothetical protein